MFVVNYYRILEVQNISLISYEVHGRPQAGSILAIVIDSEDRRRFTSYLLKDGEYVRVTHEHACFFEYLYTSDVKEDEVEFLVERVSPPEVPVLTR